MLEVSDPHVVLSCVKSVKERAFVLRLTESIGQAKKCVVKIPGATRVYVSNMLEEKKEPIELQNGKLEIAFTPWQIRTIYVEMEA